MKIMKEELRKEFIEKINRIEKKGKFNEYDSLEEFRTKIERKLGNMATKC